MCSANLHFHLDFALSGVHPLIAPGDGNGAEGMWNQHSGSMQACIWYHRWSWPGVGYRKDVLGWLNWGWKGGGKRNYYWVAHTRCISLYTPLKAIWGGHLNFLLWVRSLRPQNEHVQIAHKYIGSGAGCGCLLWRWPRGWTRNRSDWMW